MQTLFAQSGVTLNNRNINWTNRSVILAAGTSILFRLRMLDVRAGASLAVSADVTFPGGNTKHFERVISTVGSFTFGGWAGAERAGQLTCSGLADATGRVTFDVEVVSFEQDEDVPEWS